MYFMMLKGNVSAENT